MNFKQFINPHQHSDHSFDGAATIEQIVDRSKELGASHVAITEHGNMNSAMELYSICKKKNIIPIAGVELYIETPFKEEIHRRLLMDLPDDGTGKRLKKISRKVAEDHCHLTVLFKDEWAYKYFCQLTPKMEERAVVRYSERKPIITWDELSVATGHIVICSGCPSSPIHKWIKPWHNENRPDLAEKMYNVIRNIAGPGNFFVEIIPNTLTHYWSKPQKNENGRIVAPGQFLEMEKNDIARDGDYQKICNVFALQMAQKYGDPAVISLDSHYAYKQQKLIQDARLSNGQDQWKFHNYYHILTSIEAADFLNHSLNLNDHQIAEMINNSYIMASHFNDFRLTTNKERWILEPVPDNFLLILNKLITRHGRMDWNNPAMVERLQKEVDVLANNGKLNLLSYFFTIEEMAHFCKENGILINVRGSAAGSLLLYLIGVSAINPLKHGLSFERFLTSGRINANKLPDVDIDVSTGGREQLFDFLRQKYGDRFCQLSIDTTLKLKSSIKDAERTIYGVVTGNTEALCKILPQEPQGVSSRDIVFGYTDSMGESHPGLVVTHEKLKKYINTNREVWTMVCELLGIQRQKSVHACGCVIADRPVQEYCPIIRINNTSVTGFSPKSIEAAGLVKYDILGLNTLFDIQNCLLSIQKRHNIILDLWNLPYDSLIFQEFSKGNTETVFQFDTDNVRPYLISICPQNIDDLAAITSLCRPGTLDAIASDGRTLAQVFVAHRNGESIEYIHPDLEPILKSTMGIQLFQEQTLQIFRDIAEYSYEEAEMVRQGIGKKEEKILAEATRKLKEKCLQRGWTEQQSQLLVDQVMASARYAFNKSHATSYAYVAYACMYLKTHYKLDWWKAILSNANKDELATKFWKYVKQFIALPDINNISYNYEIVGDKLVAPISIINGVGDKAYQALVSASPYSDFKDFVAKHLGPSDNGEAKRRPVHSGIIRKLIIAGVLDSLFDNAQSTLEEKLHLFEIVKAEVKGVRPDPIPPEYIGITELGRYLMKKELINVYSEDLREIMLPPRGGKKLSDDLWVSQDRKPIINAAQLKYVKYLAEHGKWDGSGFGCLGYVIKEIPIRYQNKTKQATKILLDLNGDFIEEVLWPPKEGNTSESGFQGQPVLVIYWASKTRVGIQRIIRLLKKSDSVVYNVI